MEIKKKENKKFMILSATFFKQLIENGTIKFDTAEINVERIRKPEIAVMPKEACYSEVPQAMHLQPPVNATPKPQGIKCDHCDAVLSSTTYLLKHYKENHPNAEPPRMFECKECGFKAKTNSYLEMHKRKHNREQPYSCPYCDKRFTAANSRDYHISSQHPDLEHPCQQCRWTAKDYSSLQSHVASAHGSRPAPACPLCKRRFERPADLDYHLTVVHKLPYPCTNPAFCKRRFATKEAAQQHLRNDHVQPHMPLLDIMELQ